MAITHRDGFPLSYEVTGREDAPPLLLVMGLSFSSRAWELLPVRLAERFRVITLDNRWTGRSRPVHPGTGSTEPARRPWWLRRAARLGGEVTRRVFSIADLADDAAHVLDVATAQRPHRRAFVFGVSMGGMIAEELALRHPDRVQKLALGCTFAGFSTSIRPPLAVTRDLLLATSLPSAARRTRMNRHLASADFLAREGSRFERWLTSAEYAGPAVALAQLQAVRRHDTTARLGGLRAPTLVITGDDDRLIPPENSQVLSRLIPGSRLVLLRGAGHVFPLEREAETSAALFEHFGGRG